MQSPRRQTTSAAALFAAIILIACVGCAPGPTLIHGRAYVNGEPSLGAQISLSGGGRDTDTTTNDQGYFEFKDVPPGKYFVRITWANGSFNLGQAVEVRVRGGKRRVTLRD